MSTIFYNAFYKILKKWKNKSEMTGKMFVKQSIKVKVKWIMPPTTDYANTIELDRESDLTPQKVLAMSARRIDSVYT